MKQYEPKKKKYNDLLSLHDEMLRSKEVKSLEYNGASIKTKSHIYTLLDGEISIRKK